MSSGLWPGLRQQSRLPESDLITNTFMMDPNDESNSAMWQGRSTEGSQALLSGPQPYPGLTHPQLPQAQTRVTYSQQTRGLHRPRRYYAVIVVVLSVCLTHPAGLTDIQVLRIIHNLIPQDVRDAGVYAVNHPWYVDFARQFIDSSADPRMKYWLDYCRYFWEHRPDPMDWLLKGLSRGFMSRINPHESLRLDQYLRKGGSFTFKHFKNEPFDPTITTPENLTLILRSLLSEAVTCDIIIGNGEVETWDPDEDEGNENDGGDDDPSSKKGHPRKRVKRESGSPGVASQYQSRPMSSYIKTEPGLMQSPPASYMGSGITSQGYQTGATINTQPQTHYGQSHFGNAGYYVHGGASDNDNQLQGETYGDNSFFRQMNDLQNNAILRSGQGDSPYAPTAPPARRSHQQFYGNQQVDSQQQRTVEQHRVRMNLLNRSSRSAASHRNIANTVVPTPSRGASQSPAMRPSNMRTVTSMSSPGVSHGQLFRPDFDFTSSHSNPHGGESVGWHEDSLSDILFSPRSSSARHVVMEQPATHSGGLHHRLPTLNQTIGTSELMDPAIFHGNVNPPQQRVGASAGLDLPLITFAGNEAGRIATSDHGTHDSMSNRDNLQQQASETGPMASLTAIPLDAMGVRNGTNDEPTAPAEQGTGDDQFPGLTQPDLTQWFDLQQDPAFD